MIRLYKGKKLSESLLIAMLMALVGGYLDIYTYLARGKVFANTQTGNLVLLGLNMAEGNHSKVIYYILPILFFMCAVALAEIIEHRFLERSGFAWLHVTLGLEMLALFIVMFIPKGSYDILANITISFVCGLQVQTFRKVNDISYSTTMFTGNVKNAAERLSNYIVTKEESALKNGIIYCTIILMFIFGAYIGDLLTCAFDEKSVGFVNIVLAFVFILLYLEKKSLQRISIK